MLILQHKLKNITKQFEKRCNINLKNKNKFQIIGLDESKKKS